MPKLSLTKLERHLYGAADILRREGLDAATYKDYIFGMLFLKRCSDVFEAAHDEIITRKVEQGVAMEDAEAGYGENPDYYDEFFVPERARWSFLQARLNDATVTFGSVLDTALAALAEANETLEHVLDHISFLRMQSNKRLVSDDACKDLVRHFTRYRLRNEDFQFSDLLGSAYEFLINMFAESAGKKGGDFYTPRDVIRLMVRILKPRPGLSVYDPTCGSGGMLIISREYIEQSGGDMTNLRLCGQVNDASAWAICKLNMLLHGIPGADIQLQDTLLHPMHREGGELERFDRVIANPPFSQNYTKSNMEFPERFRWGWCPTTGKKGDLMFAQHMLTICKPGGMVATVMPHGVLFRGGEEKKIRAKFLDEDLIEAVISLPQNLFYGATIPACILIMRPNLTGEARNPYKPEERRGQVLFINADAEFHAGRAQNYLRPEHVEKIVSTYERFENIQGYARRVSLEEITGPANDYNLNIRRYVDNSPPPEPHDVRAHLLGGVPAAEVAAQSQLFTSLGFDSGHVFNLPSPSEPTLTQKITNSNQSEVAGISSPLPTVGEGQGEGEAASYHNTTTPHPNPLPLRGEGVTTKSFEGAYLEFSPALTERSAIRKLIEQDAGILERIANLHAALTSWWQEHSPRLAELPERRNLNSVRTEILNSFVTALLPLESLDRFKLSGIIATWWTDTLPDFKTLVENGFPGVIDGWIDAIADAVEDDEASPTFDPFAHKLVRRTMADYLERIAAAKADITRLKGEKEAFEQSNAPDDLEEEELAVWNYAKDLERQMKELKGENRDALKELKKLDTYAAKVRATDADKRAASRARESLKDILAQMTDIEEALEPYEQIKTDLSAARNRYRDLTNSFVAELKGRCNVMTDEEKRLLVLELFAQDVRTGLDVAVSEKRQELVRFVEGVWAKYRTTLAQLRMERSTIEVRMGEYLQALRYT